jgi:hypothetical protein
MIFAAWRRQIEEQDPAELSASGEGRHAKPAAARAASPPWQRRWRDVASAAPVPAADGGVSEQPTLEAQTTWWRFVDICQRPRPSLATSLITDVHISKTEQRVQSGVFSRAYTVYTVNYSVSMPLAATGSESSCPWQTVEQRRVGTCSSVEKRFSDFEALYQDVNASIAVLQNLDSATMSGGAINQVNGLFMEG